MNYRHAFHAGNHADVLKHSVLARIIDLLRVKDKPFAFLDAHAGIGHYDLESEQALKTGEWQSGIGKMDGSFSDDVEAVLAPYRSVILKMNSNGGARNYPGSPKLVLDLLRKTDRLIANELHPEDLQTLRYNIGQDQRVQISQLDAGLAVKSQLPFKERRGVILLDAPFEVLDETDRIVRTLELGHKRFSTGVFVVWYPVTTDEFATKFIDAIRDLAFPNMLHVELRVKTALVRGGLSGSGLVIINPPWNLEPDLQVLMPALAERLGIEGRGHGLVQWLTPPT